MANLNKVMLIGRLTRDPEARTFNNGGKVVSFGFAVTNRRKNGSTGQWEDEPMFIDCKVFNRGENGKQADLVEQSLSKGKQVFLEGKLVLEQWEDKNGGGKRSKHVIVVDNFQFLEPKDGGQGGQQRPQGQQQRQPAPARQPAQDTGYDDGQGGWGNGDSGEDIPF